MFLFFHLLNSSTLFSLVLFSHLHFHAFDRVAGKVVNHDVDRNRLVVEKDLLRQCGFEFHGSRMQMEGLGGLARVWSRRRGLVSGGESPEHDLDRVVLPHRFLLVVFDIDLQKPKVFITLCVRSKFDDILFTCSVYSTPKGWSSGLSEELGCSITEDGMSCGRSKRKGKAFGPRLAHNRS